MYISLYSGLRLLRTAIYFGQLGKDGSLR